MSKTESLTNETRPTSAADDDAVTVLMPVYNGERFLAGQIESILAQDHSPLRLVVVDDGSEDGSYDMLQEIATHDDRVMVSKNPTNIGLVPTIGRLLRTVETPFFALSDQDDVWDPAKVSRSVAALQSAEVALVYSDVRVCDDLGAIHQPTYLHSRGIKPVEGRDPVPFVFRNPAIGHTIVATRAVAELAQEIPQDLMFHEVWIVAAACMIGRVRFIDEQLGSYRMHDSNVVGPKKGNAARRVLDLATERGHLAQRQRTRAAGLRAVALLHPDLSPIADLYSRRGLARLWRLPRLSVFMARLAPRIGLSPAATELVIFVLDSIVCGDRRTPSRRSGNTRASAPISPAGG